MKFISNIFQLATSFIISVFLLWFIASYFLSILIVAGIAYAYFKLKKTSLSWAQYPGIYKWLNKHHEDLKNISISVVTFMFCMAVWELYLRNDVTLQSYPERNHSGEFQSPYDDPNTGQVHVYKPYEVYDDYSKEFHHRVRANSLGLNDKEYKLKTDSAIRIAALGDSFTEGVGSVGDSSYPKILQTILRQTEVMDCGVAGSDPIFEYELLKQKLLDYEPTIATFAINESDINDIIVRGGFERFKPDGTFKCRKGPWWQSLFADWYIIRFIVLKQLHMDFSFLTPEQRNKEEIKAIEILKTGIDSIQTLCNNHNIRCIFIFHPAQFEINNGKMLCEPVMDYATQHGYETIDLLAYFRKNGVDTNNAGNYFWPIDTHNKNAGYRLFAQAIKEELSRYQK